MSVISTGVLMFFLATGALVEQAWPLIAPPPNTVVLPVVTPSSSVGETIAACMYPGARPQPYRVVARTCRQGAEHCTAFVAVPHSEAQILVAGYDLANPPAESVGASCSDPEFRPSGLLSRDAKKPNS